MALIKCSECGKEISDKAQFCINCGNPISQERNKGLVTIKYKLPQNQVVLATSVKVISCENNIELAKLKVETTETIKINEEHTIMAKVGFTKSNKITIRPNEENKIIITYSGTFNKLTINKVDNFID